MTKTLKNAALAGLVALGALAAVPAAHADNLNFSFGLTVGEGRHHGHDWRLARVCTPQRAVNKAERLGFRRVAVERVGRDRIVVSGRRGGERRDVVFARGGANCPVIRVR